MKRVWTRKSKGWTLVLMALLIGFSMGGTCDNDNDGYYWFGPFNNTAIRSYGYAEEDLDCNDKNADIHPGAPELCDALDNDCDGELSPTEIDLDGDGYMACEECNDADALINPEVEEVCDGVDDNCDGILLDGETIDADGDGLLACEDPYDAVVEAGVDIKPEVFNKNTGVFTAFVELPAEVDPALVVACEADGAAAVSIQVAGDRLICKFNRDEITVLPVDTIFEVIGATDYGQYFAGVGMIRRVQP